MKKILTFVFIISMTTNLLAKETDKTKEMSNEDVDKWFKEYMTLDAKEKKLDNKIVKLDKEEKKLDKLNNTLDELTNMVDIKK